MPWEQSLILIHSTKTLVNNLKCIPMAVVEGRVKKITGEITWGDCEGAGYITSSISHILSSAYVNIYIVTKYGDIEITE